jgi:hypothetical protein
LCPNVEGQNQLNHGDNKLLMMIMYAVYCYEMGFFLIVSHSAGALRQQS